MATSSASTSQQSLKMPPADALLDTAEFPSATPPGRINLTIPHNLLVLPASAAFVGLVIGMSRGGSRARLRFLAENAHRPPTTIQGWYFYTKTRNYRVFFSAAKTGAKYALGLGGATAGFVILDESAGWVRERVMNVQPEDRKGKGRAMDEGDVVERRIMGGRQGWRNGPVHWGDGAVAGMIMGTAVGFAYTLPRPLFIRALTMGTLLGGLTSALHTVRDSIGRRMAQDAEPRLPTALPPITHSAAGGILGSGDELSVDRKVRVGETSGEVPVDETRADIVEAEGKSGTWYSWIPGLGR